MMSNTVHGESTFENRRRSRAWTTLMVDHDACPAEAAPRIRHHPGGVESQPL